VIAVKIGAGQEAFLLTTHGQRREGRTGSE